VPGRLIALPGATVAWQPHWLCAGQADVLLDHLLGAIDWQVHRIRLYGRWVDCPRRSCWIGDADAGYRYSGASFTPQPWTAVLAALRAQLESACGARFNSVLLNLYRDGNDSMGWHADDEPELGPAPVIASLSLGAQRDFQFRPRAGGPISCSLAVGHGDLLVMSAQTQRLYHHGLPKRRRVTQPRINLTFRWTQPPMC
jgi:alkylated DNA repair dioxygenase AlkB